jgi:hypothetical protein
VDCDDSNPCTVDACVSPGGCTSTAGNAGAPCRLPAGPCDAAEACNGIDPTCPTDGFLGGATECRPASCSSGVGTPATPCDGTGPGCPTATTLPCAPYVCGSTACLTSCAADTDCEAGSFCDSIGQCAAQGAVGDPCAAGNECLNNRCVDGFCCDADCTGQCEACNGAAPGTCAPATGSPVGIRPACLGDGSACHGFCDGIDTTICALPGTSTICRPPTCVVGVATLQAS